jgi:hypothetical protein
MYIEETVIAYGHDNVENLGQTMNDYMNIWTMMWLAGVSQYSKQITFLNIDAIREGHNYNDKINQFFG